MITIKSPSEIQIMADGGAKLGRVKNALAAAVKKGVSALDIENLAMKLIKEEGAEPSFTKEHGYYWATCVNINEGIVHGIPTADVVFEDGDIVSIDVGIYYKGFHTDTSVTVGVNPTSETKKFLNTGILALQKAIKAAKEGNHIYDISKAIEDTIEAEGYTTIKALVGHGVGKSLHEDPQIPCFVPERIEDSPAIKKGMTLAVEVMYAEGGDKVEILEDGWTIAMQDGKMSGLFEETVAITDEGNKVLTR
ncbi:MAG: methionine aminopeptidase, type I, methionyl aminopeptidase [Microgenomates group bacterium GW2011_GWC1_41_20]|uniref:Methionine aminopeptidase n=7 Tax=Candidatus Woeseibacteriota TaxID=1752722 RepID=A0A0G0U9R4_9BACT|nr:MAG: Methionine aminopeptidase [Candidatus Woesebacteria bacterium GW2011_GWB1_40_12]KKR56230.1 MAG: Methionine aminopeptidase [Candidatus Woesebacteria bacterium GW2011_GWF1_40_24]KKR90736.1 MAG: Methionine aminopeptidase [Candidatus Woesebacteria bacterium GW2011_GWD1_41_12]KKS00791.1 MAG: methionine aminopeptidase, type I, methionyl aminopeptidase [Microgenomates group bacterium GW2011_GWC1_41_20]KKS05770.1 MAG: Methionine aminopeptidase [Candidatus Woesebacteria bacterium GW2011_GWE1_41_